MAESSLFWITNGTGDGTDTGYTQTQVFEWLRSLFVTAATNLGGVSPDYQNKLAVSGTSSPVSVATGAALVYGIPYVNTAAVTVAIPTPTTATRIDRIVLRANYTTQTVRITRIAGSEGGAAPSLTQSAGTTWDIPLAQASITTAGVITVTDQREWLSLVGDGAVTAAKLAASAVTLGKIGPGAVGSTELANGAVSGAKIIAGAVDNTVLANNSVTTSKIVDGNVTGAKLGTNAVTTANIADDAVTVDKVGAGLPVVVKRQGGSTTNWQTYGTTNYTPSGVRAQVGVYRIASPPTTNSTATITFPQAFSNSPIVLFSPSSDGTVYHIDIETVSATQVQIRYAMAVGDEVSYLDINWLAIGPE